MSNVLIGIIGVILFIGLALAGALFLGPRFQEATLNSKASASVQAVSQVAQATSMRNVQTGTTQMAGLAIGDLVSTGFLKAEPTNPTGSEGMQIFGSLGEGGAGNVRAGMVVMRMIGNGKAVCDAISRQTSGQTYTTAEDALQLPKAPTGCFKTGESPVFSLTADSYFAYARM